MSDNRPVCEDDLHAYADGLLDEAGQKRIESHLAENPQAARMIADWQAQNDGLRNAFSNYAQLRTSDLQRVVRSHAPPLSGRRRGFTAVTAAAFIFALGGLAGHLGSTALKTPPRTNTTIIDLLPQEASNAYLVYAGEVRHPVEVFADQEAHLATWLGKRLSIADLKVPNLQALGFRLVGGRLLPVADKPGALFMYEDEAGRRVTVLLGRNEENRTTSFRFASASGVETFYWIDGDLGYAVTGDVPRDLLQRIAEACYKQFPT